MHIITNQMIINAVREAVKNGTLQAISNPGGNCFYRTPNGNKCAIGSTLSEETLFKLSVKGQNEASANDIDWAAFGVQFEDPEFAYAMQFVHDGNGVEYGNEMELGQRAFDFVANLDGSLDTVEMWNTFLDLIQEHLDSKKV